MNSSKSGHYDGTISESKEESLARAMEIMMDDIKKNQKVQIITRPKVSLIKGLIPILIAISLYVVFLIYLDNISYVLAIDKIWILLSVTAIYLLLGCLCMKKFLIWLILLYQKYAPEKVRKMCYFEPSCSEYMKLSIQKYGVLRGVYKGFNRIQRCHWPNGGVDYP